MPNIRSSFVDPATGSAGATSSEGSSVLITPARVQLLVGNLAGSDPALTHTTVQRQLAQVISDTLGPESVSPDQVTIDYDDATGFVTDLGFLA